MQTKRGIISSRGYYNRLQSAFPLNIHLVLILEVIDRGLVKLGGLGGGGGGRAYKLVRGGVAYKQQFSSLQYTLSTANCSLTLICPKLQNNYTTISEKKV